MLWKLYLFVKKHTRPPKKAKYDDQGGENTTLVGPGTPVSILISLASSSSESDGEEDSGSASE